MLKLFKVIQFLQSAYLLYKSYKIIVERCDW